MSEDTVIAVENVSKAYRIWESPAARLTSPLLEGVTRLLPDGLAPARWLQQRAARDYRDFWALKDISFQVRPGESVGLIGRNGSGKSTLLQIIAGTLQATTGSVRVNGRVAAMLELGSGFNPDFTGRENVHLNAAVLGVSRREVEERFDQIAAFADIGEFIEQPVKTYSSGMLVRLAFAVQTAVEPQVLIVDEALSVGDVFFQQRCYERMRQLLDRGVCVVLASHDLAAVQQFCAQTLVLRHGQTAFQGPSAEATKAYFQFEQQERSAAYAAVAAPDPGRKPAPAAGPRPSIPDWPGPAACLPLEQAKIFGNGWARCTTVALGTDTGEPRVIFRQGETLAVFYEFEILQDMEFCVGGITIRNRTTQAVHSRISLQDGVVRPAQVAAGARLRFRQDVELNLECSDYTLDVTLSMIGARLLDQPGITYEEFMASHLRVCELHGIAAFSVRLRDESRPFQLLHFGMAGLPGRSMVELHPPSL